MPLFALANTSIILPLQDLSAMISSLSIGVVLGLLIGKPLGIFMASYVAVKKKIARLPEEVNWNHVLGAGCTAGIGFTMSIFIAGLSFSDPFYLDEAKLSVLAGSFLSAVAGWIILSSRKKSLT